MFLSKEAKKEFDLYKFELKKKEEELKRLIKHDMDWAALQEFINKCNNNPGLHIKVTLKDGTVIDMTAEKDQKNNGINPLFTEAVYKE